MKRSYSTRFNPYEKGVKTLVNVGKLAYKGYKSYKSYANKKVKDSPYQGVTTQHDRANVYKKKYMPRRRKTQWKSFVRKVQAVNMKDRGLVTALFNSVFNPVASSASAQLITELHLYGGNSTDAVNSPGVADLSQIVLNDWNTRFGTNLTGTVTLERSLTPATDNIQIESAILDATITNNNSTTVEIDVYTIYHKKYTKGAFTSLKDVYSKAASSVYTDVVESESVAQSLLTLDSRGCTPFDLGKGSSLANLVISRKEKYLISAGQAITLQMRDAKNRRLNPQDILTSTSPCYKYSDWTRSYLIIGKKLVEDANPMSLRMGVTRTYKYTYEGLKENQAYKKTI